MAAYYNEIDPQAAQWLRNLIAAGEIAPGEVDERSIRDVAPSDLVGFTQCHFFAGVGVWSDALRRAGWPDERPVWTGSCPCQPFSSAGKGLGFDDPRHLWPTWWQLIRERRPSVVFGEQVSDKGGPAWLGLVQSDLESEGYAVGPLVLPAAGFGAPHGRHRIFFVAESGDERCEGIGLHLRERGPFSAVPEARRGGEAGIVAYTDGWEPGNGGIQPGGEHRQQPAHGGARGDLADAERERGCRGESRSEDAGDARFAGEASFWSACDWLPCTDGKARPVEPGTFPLVNGAPSRLVRLRAYGNAIVAPVAEEFIRAYLEVTA